MTPAATPARHRLLAVLSVVTAATLILLGGLALVPALGGWPPAEKPPSQGEALDPVAYRHGQYVQSEAALHRLIREPQNTWSNLAFVAGGAYLLLFIRRSRSRLVGAILIGVGMASFMYHAAASRPIRNYDVGAMYAVLGVTALLCLGVFLPRFARWLDQRALVAGVLCVAAAAIVTVERNWRVWGVKPFALLIVTEVASAVLIGTLLFVAWRTPRRDVRIAIALSLGFYTIAAACHTGDRPGSWLCVPGYWIQPHAVWHVLSAAALVLAVWAIERAEAGDGDSIAVSPIA